MYSGIISEILKFRFWCLANVMLAVSATLFSAGVLAGHFDVHTVPLNPNDRLIRHDIISGVETTLKAACETDTCVGYEWTWNPGDGSADVVGTVNPNPVSNTQLDDPGFTPYWSIWTEHTYDCNDGDVFNATITVDDGAGETNTDIYRMVCRAVTLPVEVNATIDEMLWHMHRNQLRFDGTVTGGLGGAIPMGGWDYPQTSGRVEPTVSGASTNAFEANGYLETGPADSPYTETVDRGLKALIARLISVAMNNQTVPAGRNDDPDSNGNGFGIAVNAVQQPYQSGMVMDAIIASANPGAVATTGPANVIGLTYGDIIQDMVDWYAWAQSDNANHGGWRYNSWNNQSGTTDNSTNGWAAIGMVAAEDNFGATVPQFVKDKNEDSLEFTDTESNTNDNDGMHGYVGTGLIWSGTAATGAAMVQMSFDDLDTTATATPDERWIRTENWHRRHWDDVASGNNFKNYYYAMFNFVKAMRVADSPVVIIGTEVGAADGGIGCGPNAACAAGGPRPLDWYNDPNSGIARTVVDYVVKSGVNIGSCSDRPGNSQGSNQDDHNTPWCTQMLTQTLFQAGPVARAEAAPNPGAINQDIEFNGANSFHQDPARSLVLFEWDLDNDGTFDVSGITTTTLFPALGAFPVTLRVTDDAPVPQTDTDVVIVNITIPPHAPTADTGGPYLACLDVPLTLDGSGSFDVDDGTSESGQAPFDMITAWEWDLDGDLAFDDASGEMIENTYAALGVFELGLKVTDNTFAAFPSAESDDLMDTDFSTVTVLAADDPFCRPPEDCPPVTVRPKRTKNQLVWDPVATAVSYTISRSTTGPDDGFEVIADGHVTNFATYLDLGLETGTTYWYVVTAIDDEGGEICVTEPASGTPGARVRDHVDAMFNGNPARAEAGREGTQNHKSARQ